MVPLEFLLTQQINKLRMPIGQRLLIYIRTKTQVEIPQLTFKE